MRTESESSQQGPSTALIALAGPRRLAKRLEKRGFRLMSISSGPAPAGEPDSIPRLALLAAGKASDSSLVGEVEAVRRRWPLVDVLVFAPQASARLVRELLRAGARDVVLEDDELCLLQGIEDTLDAQQLLPMVERLAERRVRSSRFEGMLSRSHAMWDVFETCARVAPTDVTVLICGETGTGKELLARAVHRRSKRRGPARARQLGLPLRAPRAGRRSPPCRAAPIGG